MKKQRKLKAINTKKKNNSVATTDEPTIPKASWDEEEKRLYVYTECSGRKDWIKSMGSVDLSMANMLLSQIINPICYSPSPTKQFIEGSIAMYRGIEPNDPLECMLASQMVAVHSTAMECMRKSMHKSQTPQGKDTNINQATKLMRTFTAQVETLKRYRTGGKQTIQVQHVNVNEGGQAIVGNIKGGKGDG
jgi:hypothetical protein